MAAQELRWLTYLLTDLVLPTHAPCTLPHLLPPAPALSSPLQAQVQRMLRLSPACQAAVQAFHRRHPAAAAAGFGRLFRSPSLFEDLVKAQLLCNCGWGRSLGMARALCLLHRHHFGPPLGARDSPECVGAFPEPHELARLEISYLTSRCGLGYRGPRIARLAADVASGAIDLEALQRDCLQENSPSGGDVATVGTVSEMADEPAVGGGARNKQRSEGEEMSQRARARGAGDVGVDAIGGACRRKRRRSWDDGGGEMKAAKAAEEKQAPVVRGNCSPTAREEVPCSGTAARGHAGCTAGTVDALAARAYAAHAPFQFLAYWWEVWGEYERVFGRMAHLPRARYHAITGHNMRTAGGAAVGGRGGGDEASHGGGGDAVEAKAGGSGGGGGVMVSAQRRHTGRRRSQGRSTSRTSRSRGEAEGDSGVDEGGAGRGGIIGKSRAHAATAGVVHPAGEVSAATDGAGVAAGSGDGRVCVQCGVAGMGVRRSRRVMAQRTQCSTASGTAACSKCWVLRGGVQQQGVDGTSRERGNGRRRGHSGGGERGGDSGVGRMQGAGGGGRRGSAAVGRGRGKRRRELERGEVGGSEVGEERGGEAGMAMVVQSGEEEGRECVRSGAGQAAEQQQRENAQGQQRLEQQGGEQAWVQGEQQAANFHTGVEMGTAGAWAVGAVQASSDGGTVGGQEAEACGKGRAGHEEVAGRHRPNRRLLL
ncbi:unnamed protein product [Closterium sp. Naga37s-1]|nr:unnamed protein product [Closterium sp. Naga37s-1]